MCDLGRYADVLRICSVSAVYCVLIALCSSQCGQGCVWPGQLQEVHVPVAVAEQSTRK